MSASKFTIGIPTFNRLSCLKRSLECALAQSHDNVEVVICDNASSDGTREFCESLGDSRVVYVRNEANLGPVENFRQCLRNAHGEHFSWLQDDDFIFPDFTARATCELCSHEADVYLATAIATASPDFIYWDSLYGPPLELSWGTGATVIVGSNLTIPLSMLCTIAIPPVVAFRTEFLRGIMEEAAAPDCLIFWERLLLIVASTKGKVIAAPHIAGIFHMHSAQSCVQMSQAPGEFEKQWNVFVTLVEAIESLNGLNWDEFQQYVANLPDNVLKKFIAQISSQKIHGAVCRRCQMILNSESALRWPNLHLADNSVPRKLVRYARSVLRQVVPPIIHNLGGQCETYLRTQVVRLLRHFS